MGSLKGASDRPAPLIVVSAPVELLVAYIHLLLLVLESCEPAPRCPVSKPLPVALGERLMGHSVECIGNSMKHSVQRSMERYINWPRSVTPCTSFWSLPVYMERFSESTLVSSALWLGR